MSPTPTDQNPAQPIAIDTKNSPTPAANRPRSNSLWSNPGLSPSSSPISPPMSALQTPSSFSSAFPRPISSSPPSTVSPLSYILAGSPVKSAFSRGNSLPGGGGGGGGIGAQAKAFSDGSSAIAEEDDTTSHKVSHARAASANWSTTGQDRVAGVMRRLSLGGALASNRPSAAVSGPDKTSRYPISPQSPQSAATAPAAKDSNDIPILSPAPTPAARRTRNPTPVKKRSVSPMGERMLQGHFDGFGL